MSTDTPARRLWAPAHWSRRVRLEAHRRWNTSRVVLQGHHNENVVVRLDKSLARIVPPPAGTTHAKFRTPLRTLEVVPRLWTDEYDILKAVRPYLENTPQPLTRYGRLALHAYVEGVPIGYRYPRGEPLDDKLLRRTAEVMGMIASVPRAALPAIPGDWPGHAGNAGFLRWLVDFSEDQVRRRYLPQFGSLFSRLRLPEDAVSRFRDRASTLSDRPLCLVHADLHRDNLILQPDGGLCVLDWEFALLGDPLHELATHLIRMGYSADECGRMTDYWQNESDPQRTRGLAADLPLFMDYERAQSVLTDTMRAASSLRPQPSQPALEGAAGAIRRALHNAQRPLGLEDIPTEHETIDALLEWKARRVRGLRGR